MHRRAGGGGASCRREDILNDRLQALLLHHRFSLSVDGCHDNLTWASIIESRPPASSLLFFTALMTSSCRNNKLGTIDSDRRLSPAEVRATALQSGIFHSWVMICRVVLLHRNSIYTGGVGRSRPSSGLWLASYSCGPLIYVSNIQSRAISPKQQHAEQRDIYCEKQVNLLTIHQEIYTLAGSTRRDRKISDTHAPCISTVYRFIHSGRSIPACKRSTSTSDGGRRGGGRIMESANAVEKTSGLSGNNRSQFLTGWF